MQKSGVITLFWFCTSVFGAHGSHEVKIQIFIQELQPQSRTAVFRAFLFWNCICISELQLHSWTANSKCNLILHFCKWFCMWCHHIHYGFYHLCNGGLCSNSHHLTFDITSVEHKGSVYNCGCPEEIFPRLTALSLFGLIVAWEPVEP